MLFLLQREHSQTVLFNVPYKVHVKSFQKCSTALWKRISRFLFRLWIVVDSLRFFFIFFVPSFREIIFGFIWEFFRLFLWLFLLFFSFFVVVVAVFVSFRNDAEALWCNSSLFWGRFSGNLSQRRRFQCYFRVTGTSISKRKKKKKKKLINSLTFSSNFESL